MAGNKRMIRKRKSRVFLFLLLCITVFSALSSTEYKKKSSQTGKTEGKAQESGVARSKVAAGYAHTCAIKDDGSLWCWGDNNFGQIGDGTKKNKYSPVKIIESGVVSVAAGGAHTCAIKKDRSLWCWGNNFYGQIGDGTEGNRKYSPVKIIELVEEEIEETDRPIEEIF
jgi:alpha-tubulin suppressor-like RCC1 family protein